MAFQTTPAWFQNGVNHNAIVYRTMVGNLIGHGVSGVVNENSLKVTETATPSMSVDISSGGGFIASTRGEAQGTYVAYNDGIIKVDIDPGTANPRIDRILVQVRDSAQDIALTEDDITIYVQKGNPSSTPVLPAVTIQDWMELARVLVPAGESTAIEDEDITDVRNILMEEGPQTGTELIEEIRLTSDQSEINITDIPQTFRDLRLILYVSGASGTETTLRMRFNGVTTDTYRTLVNQNQGGTLIGAVNDVVSSWRIGDVSDVTASNWSQGIVNIAEYTSNMRPSPTFECVCRRASNLDRWTNGGLLTLTSATSPVTSIQVFTNIGALSAGSVARLYGIR